MSERLHRAEDAPKYGEEVRVYWNLRKKMFSVQAKRGGRYRVVLHAQYVFIDAPSFKVSEAGRQRVLRDKRKNVHAGVHGAR